MKTSGNREYLSRRFAYFLIAVCAVVCAADVAVWYFAARAGHGYAVAVALTAVLAVLFVVLKVWIVEPYRQTERMLSIFSKGYSTEGVDRLRWRTSPGVEELVGRMESLLSSDEAMNLSKRQAQYLAMQNQINPHFLYNTLEGIRGEALTGGLDDIAKMTETLAQFFRYTISNLDQLVTLDDELTNVRNYYHIQEYRFGDRLKLDIRVENEEEDRGLVMNAKVPKLILQPVVENAIIHGVEGMPDTGYVSILVQFTGSRLILVISDNGVGIPSGKLRTLNDRLSSIYGRFEENSGGEGGIALANVSSRIKLLFGEDYGLSVMSEEGAGTDVEITLPYLTRFSDAERAMA
jgi:two-component system sensor histidine kinase YesM